MATVLIAIIWLTSGGEKRSLKPTPPAQATPDFSRLNQAKLEEYRNQLAAQERLLREQQALLLGQQPTSPHDPTLPLDPTQGKPSSPDPREALKTQLELDQEKKNYQSLFSTNLAVSYRKESKDTTDMEGFKEFLKTIGKNPSSDSTTPIQAGTPASAPARSIAASPLSTSILSKHSLPQLQYRCRQLPPQGFFLKLRVPRRPPAPTIKSNLRPLTLTTRRVADSIESWKARRLKPSSQSDQQRLQWTGGMSRDQFRLLP